MKICGMYRELSEKEIIEGLRTIKYLTIDEQNYIEQAIGLLTEKMIEDKSREKVQGRK